MCSRRDEYRRTYERLMHRAVGRLYVRGEHERHHIIPRCVGGLDHPDNIVCLTYREHFLAHWLLAKFSDDRRMKHALFRMTTRGGGRIVSGWQFATARRAQAEAMIGVQLGKGRKKTAEEREAIRRRMLQNNPSRREEVRAKLRASKVGNKHTKGKRYPSDVYDTRRGSGSGKSRPVECLDDGKFFSTIGEAASFYMSNRSSIGAVCGGKRRTAKGLRFRYVGSAPA